MFPKNKLSEAEYRELFEESSNDEDEFEGFHACPKKV